MAENESETDLGLNIGWVLGLLTRRRWVIIGTASAIALATIAASFQIPNQYTSEATILVDAQKVSERYVVSTTNSNVVQALEAMEHEVLSRPRQLAIIDELGLYPEQKQRLAPEQLIELMRDNFSIEPFVRPGERNANTFRISFTASSPELAQKVTDRLTALFIEQNVKTRSDQATTTTTFLHEQLEITKSELASREEQLRDFKMKFLGELPEQQQGNVAILAGLETQISNVMSNRNQVQQQRPYLQSLLNEHRQRELSRLQAERKALLIKYTPQHPAVVKKDEEIQQQEVLVNDSKIASRLDLHSIEGFSTLDQDASMAQLIGQLRNNTLELENLSKQEQKLRAEINQYRSRINVTPVREQQLTSLQRDYDLLRQHYGELLRKEQESLLATNLEKRQEGQQFRLADPPNLPTRPSKPKRLKIALGALACGLVLGCAFAFLAEVKNRSFHTEEEVSNLALPMVIGVPRVFMPGERQQLARKRTFEWCAAMMLLFAVVAAEYFVYRHG